MTKPRQPLTDEEKRELYQLMENMRDELAQELSLKGYEEGYFGLATNAECGQFGHILQRRARQLLRHETVRHSGHVRTTAQVPKNEQKLKNEHRQGQLGGRGSQPDNRGSRPHNRGTSR